MPVPEPAVPVPAEPEPAKGLERPPGLESTNRAAKALAATIWAPNSARALPTSAGPIFTAPSVAAVLGHSGLHTGLPEIHPERAPETSSWVSAHIARSSLGCGLRIERPPELQPPTLKVGSSDQRKLTVVFGPQRRDSFILAV